MPNVSKIRGRKFLFIDMLGVILILAVVLVLNLMGNQ